MASYTVTTEHTYVFKCDVVILDLLTTFLRAILASKIEEKDIRNIAQAKRVLLRISKQQWQLICTCLYSNFDIAILYQLIRHVTDTEPPRNGWGKGSPFSESEQQTIGDVVEHIRRIRNETFGHLANATISEAEFQKTWIEFTEICKVMDTLLPGNNYSDKLKSILETQFNPEEAGEYERRRKADTMRDEEIVQEFREKFKCIEERLLETEKAVLSKLSLEADSLNEEDKISLRDTLLETYQDLMNVIPLSPRVQNYGLPIDALFIPLTVKEKVYIKHHRPLSRHESNNFESRILYSYDDLLARKNQDVQRIFLYGDAGGGKTCYTLKLVSLWARGQSGQSEENHFPVENVLREIDFVFYIAMKYLVGEDDTVEDIVCNDLASRNEYVARTARKALRSAESRCLIILDGLDEWPNNKIPSTINIRNCQVLLTSRQSKIAVMNLKYDAKDKIVQLQRFSPEDTEKLVPVILESFLGLDIDSEEFTPKCQEIIGHLRTPNLRHISRIPFLATYLILLLFHNTDIINSVTSLYLEVIMILIQRAISENRITHAPDSGQRKPTYLMETHKFQSLKDKHFNALLQIGSYAFDILMAETKKQGCQDMDSSKPLSEYVVHFGIETGILRKSIIPAITRSRRKFEFLHRSILEVVAAMFLVYDQSTDNFRLILHSFSHVDDMLNSELFCTFIGGLSQDYCSQLQRHLTRLLKSYARENPCHFPFYHDRRARMKATYSLFCNLFSESLTGITPPGSPTSPGSISIDVYVDEDSDEKNRYITSLILERHRESITSLFFENVSEDDTFLNQSMLGNMLGNPLRKNAHHSLHHLYIRGRYLKSLDIPHLTTLVLRDITLEVETMKCVTDAVERNSQLKNLRLTKLTCRQPNRFLHLTFHESTQLESLALETLQLTSTSFVSIQSAVKSSKALKSLRLSEMNTGRRIFDFELENKTSLTELYLHQINIDPDTFDIQRGFLANNINLTELHLDSISYGKADLVFSSKEYLRILQLAHVTLSKQSIHNLSVIIQETPELEVLILDSLECDNAVLELNLSQKKHLTTLYLSSVNVETIRLFSNMIKLDNIVLIDISMPRQDWTSFLYDLTDIQHTFDIDLDGVNMDEEHITIVTESANFIVDRKPSKSISRGHSVGFTTTLYDTK